MANGIEGIYEELNMIIEDGDKTRLKEKIKSLENINIEDKDGQTLLIYAVLRGNKKLAKALLSGGASMDVNDPKIMMYAVRSGNEKLVKMLLDKGVYININDPKMLEYAVHSGNERLVKILLDKGLYINSNDPRLVVYAALSGNTKLIKTLLKYGVNINAVKDGESALKEAVDRKDVDMFKLLVNNGADIRRYGNIGESSLLIYAVDKGANQIVNEIVKMVNYVDEVDWNMETALMHAVRHGDKDMANILFNLALAFIFFLF